MKPAAGFAEILKAISTATVLLNIGGLVAAQQKPPVVTHPTNSSAQATPRSTSSSPYGSATAAQTNVKVAAGTISGYVYWDLSAAHYKLSSPCQGLTVNVSTIGKPQAGGGQVLATTSNFTPWGPVTDGSTAGFPRYMFCTYAFFRLPVGEYLRVRVAVAANAFSEGVSVQNPPDFEIFGGNCNNTPQGTLSFILTAGEMICGNGAFNINLKLYTSGYLSPGKLPVRNGPLVQNAPGTTSSAGGTPKSNSSTGGGTASAGGTLKLASDTGGATTSSGGTLKSSSDTGVGATSLGGTLKLGSASAGGTASRGRASPSPTPPGKQH